MKRFDLWKLSLLNVFSSPVRSFLTVLGFSIGVAAILAVLTLGEAGRVQVQSEMGRLGIDRIWLTAAGDGLLERGTGEWLKETTGISAQELVYLPGVIFTENGMQSTATVIGCERDYLNGAQISKGRMLWPLEWNAVSQMALIGEKLAAKLDVEPGEIVNLSQRACYVCGIIGAGEGVSSVQLDEAVILPIDAICTVTGGVIREIQLMAPENVTLQSAQKLAVQAMERRGIAADAVTMEVQMEAATNVIFTFVNVLKWVALVCILVGGIGVMNILLVSVRERKREIGVMKSLGTTPVQICTLFLLEALVYAVIGGFLGILLGMGLIHAAGMSIELAARASAEDCVTVFLCAMAVGLLFGVLPAFRASMLKCVDALRQE